MDIKMLILRRMISFIKRRHKTKKMSHRFSFENFKNTQLNVCREMLKCVVSDFTVHIDMYRTSWFLSFGWKVFLKYKTGSKLSLIFAALLQIWTINIYMFSWKRFWNVIKPENMVPFTTFDVSTYRYTCRRNNNIRVYMYIE